MQLTILVAALLSLMICIYYLSQGRLQIIAMLQGANIAQLNKQVLLSLFYCQMGFLITTSLCLFACALGVVPRMYAYSLLLFIGLNYGIFAIWHCHIAKLGQPEKRFSLYIMALSLLLVSLFALLGALH